MIFQQRANRYSRALRFLHMGNVTYGRGAPQFLTIASRPFNGLFAFFKDLRNGQQDGISENEDSPGLALSLG
jgi:hypothetical protein